MLILNVVNKYDLINKIGNKRQKLAKKYTHKI